MATLPTIYERPVLLHGISWKTYEGFLHDYRAYSGVRLTYKEGYLEIMTPGPDHEYASQNATSVVSETTTEWNKDVLPLGSTTFRREDLERGFEPDSCFYIQNAERMRGKTEVDLNRDPPPDLVIEIDDTHSSMDKQAIFARIGVPEVWRWKDGAMTIYALENGAYRNVEISPAFAPLSATVLTDLINKSRTMRRPDWVREVRTWAQKNRPV